MSLGGSRDSYMAQSTLRTGGGAPRPEPNGHTEKPVRRCERCGCKLANDQGPYRGHLLCSPCQKPIAIVREGIPAEHRRRIVALCSGYSGQEVADALGCGLSTPGTTVFSVAKLAEVSTGTLRDAVAWGLTHGIIPYDPDFPPKERHEEPQPEPKASEKLRRLAREHARAYQDHLEDVVDGLPVTRARRLIAAVKSAYEFGRAEATAEALEVIGQ